MKWYINKSPLSLCANKTHVPSSYLLLKIASRKEKASGFHGSCEVSIKGCVLEKREEVEKSNGALLSPVSLETYCMTGHSSLLKYLNTLTSGLPRHLSGSRLYFCPSPPPLSHQCLSRSVLSSFVMSLF